MHVYPCLFIMLFIAMLTLLFTGSRIISFLHTGSLKLQGAFDLKGFVFVFPFRFLFLKPV